MSLETAPPRVSVVLSTRNRAHVLPAAVERLVDQRTSVPYEVIVVDNDSSDATPSVLTELAARHPNRLRAAFEGQRGVSHGRNRGIALSRAPIVAFTDDDVCVTRDWVQPIADAMEQHPEVDCVGGRVLPVWTTPPPSWLTRRHWSPLALVDYGEEQFYVDKTRAVCLVTASVAYRRSALDHIGWFAAEFRRCQDHELLLRFWDAGLRALYLPHLVVTCEVPPSRLTWSYHRRWHYEHGRFSALMPDQRPDGPRGDHAAGSLTLFGAPAAIYRQLLSSLTRLVIAVAVRDRPAALDASVTLRHRAAFVVARGRIWRRQRRGPLREIARFALAWALRPLGTRGRVDRLAIPPSTQENG